MESIHIQPERELQMLETLAGIAGRHVEASNGRLALLPIDPERYPAQRAYYVDGTPQGAGIIETVANAASGHFPELQRQLADIESKSQEISRVGELLKGGNNVVLATNHGDLIDIALVEAAVCCSLEKLGYQARSGIIISKMISVLGYRFGEEVTPAVDALQLLCDDIYLSFPRTETTSRSGLARLLPSDIERHNRKMRQHVKRNLKQGQPEADTPKPGGLLLAMAPSGTTDKQTAERNFRLGTIGHGTAEMMTQDKTYVLPMAVWLQPEATSLALADVPRVLRDEAAAHRTMGRIATTLTGLVGEKTFHYAAAKEMGGLLLSSELSA